jgi:hypothetical protein
MSTQRNNISSTASKPSASQSPSSGRRSSMTLPDIDFFRVALDQNIFGAPTRRAYPSNVRHTLSFGSSAPSFHNSEVQCTCPLFLSAPDPDSATTLCGKHDVPSTVSVSDQKTPVRTSDGTADGGTAEKFTLKRKCMTITNAWEEKADMSTVQRFSPPPSIPQSKKGTASRDGFSAQRANMQSA